MTRFVLIVASWLGAAAAEYTGSPACTPCHPGQARLQSGSGHALALRPAADHPLFRTLPEDHTAYRPPEYRLSWKRSTNAVQITATDGVQVSRLPVQWAFGAGVQAITFVSPFDEDHYVEHHSTWYRSTGRFGLTPGHRATAAADLGQAFGVLYRTFAPDAAILRCFACHSTGPMKLAADFRVEPFEFGVRCEACHGPGQVHAKAPAKTNIFNPGSLTGAGMNEYCGNCHRPPASDPDMVDWQDPWNVRHQPVYLSRSRCFTESAGKLRCTTCHNPHDSLQRSSDAYNAVCGSCHSQTPDTCRSDCVSCHMPKVSPQPALTFTNHQIGVFGAGALQPQRQRR